MGHIYRLRLFYLIHEILQNFLARRDQSDICPAREVRVPTDAERETISRYCGFGGLKCVLNPVDNKAAIEREQSDARISSAEREQARLKIKAVWPKSDLPLYDLTAYRMCLCCIRKT